MQMKSWFQLTEKQLYMAEKITLFCLGFNVIFSDDNLCVLIVYCLKLRWINTKYTINTGMYN